MFKLDNRWLKCRFSAAIRSRRQHQDEMR